MPQDAALARVPGQLDSTYLASIMKALSNPARIDLLRTLQVAHTLGEIRLESRRPSKGGARGQLMNRVSTRGHLDVLLDLQMVRGIRRVRDGRVLDHYLTNHAQVFALMEELRALVRLHPEEEILDGTVPGPQRRRMSNPGPKMALVSGAREGHVFPLDDPTLERWVIGRRAWCPICLDYDPYLSLENTEIVRHGRGFAVRDLGSKNGTTLNWDPVQPGVLRPLTHGDLVGVGRSTLIFRST